MLCENYYIHSEKGDFSGRMTAISNSFSSRCWGRVVWSSEKILGQRVSRSWKLCWYWFVSMCFFFLWCLWKYLTGYDYRGRRSFNEKICSCEQLWVCVWIKFYIFYAKLNHLNLLDEVVYYVDWKDDFWTNQPSNLFFISIVLCIQTIFVKIPSLAIKN